NNTVPPGHGVPNSRVCTYVEGYVCLANPDLKFLAAVSVWLRPVGIIFPAGQASIASHYIRDRLSYYCGTPYLTISLSSMIRLTSFSTVWLTRAASTSKRCA